MKISLYPFFISVLFFNADRPDRVTGDFCGNKHLVSLEKIKSLEGYREISTVKLGSFMASEHMPMKNNEEIDTRAFFELTTITDAEKDSLFDILVNYDLPPREISGAAICYEPRNAALFYDKSHNIIGYVEICFACQRHETSPKSLKVGRFCEGKYEALQRFFARNGIEYGIAPGSDDPNSPFIGISMAQNQIDQGNYPEAIRMLDKEIAKDSTFYRYYLLRAKAMIEVYESSMGRDELLPRICNDLKKALHLGESSVADLKKEYCR